MRTCLLVVCFACGLAGAWGGDDPPKGGKKSDAVWKTERATDGQTVLSDGKLSVTFPTGAKVEVSKAYASGDIKQETGLKLKGYLSVERKDAPAEAKEAADARKWLKGYIEDQLDKDRKSEYKGEKNYNDVKLVKSSEVTLDTIKGLKVITDHGKESLGTIRIEGGYHHVKESDLYLIGDHLYILGASGSGAPTNRNAAALFGDNTGFHQSDLAQNYFKSAKVRK